MKIGIVTAIERELQIFLDAVSNITEEYINDSVIYHAELHNHGVFVIQSGCGEIDAAAATQLLITHTGCSIVINFGVAGAIVPGLNVNDLFLADKVCHYGFDISPIDPVKKHQYPEYADEFIPLDMELQYHVKTSYPDIQTVSVASGDRFIDKLEDKQELASLGCQICDMELAAIARICLKNRVKCMSIKCISDTLEGSGVDFNTNVSNSAKKAYELLDLIINLL